MVGTALWWEPGEVVRLPPELKFQPREVVIRQSCEGAVLQKAAAWRDCGFPLKFFLGEARTSVGHILVVEVKLHHDCSGSVFLRNIFTFYTSKSHCLWLNSAQILCLTSFVDGF